MIQGIKAVELIRLHCSCVLKKVWWWCWQKTFSLRVGWALAKFALGSVTLGGLTEMVTMQGLFWNHFEEDTYIEFIYYWHFFPIYKILENIFETYVFSIFFWKKCQNLYFKSIVENHVKFESIFENFIVSNECIGRWTYQIMQNTVDSRISYRRAHPFDLAAHPFDLPQILFYSETKYLSWK